MTNKTNNTKAQASKNTSASKSAQAKRTRKSAQASATNYAVVGTYTYHGEKCPKAKLGKKVPSVRIETRFRSSDFARMTSMARAHKGGYSPYAQEWLFDTTANAKAFASAIDTAVAKGEIVADPTNLARKKDRKAAGLRAHTDEWYAAREAKSAKQTSAPAKKTATKGKKSAKQTSAPDMKEMFKQFMAFMQANA